jgi:acetolactate synthase-1/2/3 large subunit
MNNAEFIVKFLLKKGCNTAFGVTGGGAMFLNEAFRKEKKLNFIFMHHEQAAAMAADAFYRVKKKPAILSVTSGPGGTNSITGVIGAWIDSVPMIVISGQVESKDLIKNTNTRQIGIQEANIIDISKSIVKYSKLLTKSSDIKFEIEKAFKIANEGRPGPVWLDIPLDVQSQKFKLSRKKKLIKDINNKKRLYLKNFYKFIKNSKRPILLIGNGLHIANAEEEFLKLINKLNLPIVSTWNASDIISSNHKLYFGRPGLFGNRLANFAVQACDLLIVLGSRLSVPITGYQVKNFSPKSKKIYVDIDNNEISKNSLKVHLSYNCDLKIFLEKLNFYLKKKKTIRVTSWIKELKKLKNTLDEDGKYKEEKKYVNSFSFINILSKVLKGNETIVTDMGTSFTCTMQTFKTKGKQRLFTSSGIASMGFGLPGSIGAYFGDKNKMPICITGDGGIMFNLQELQTFISYKIPVKIFIMNNGGYLTMKLMQDKNFKKFVGADPDSGVKFPNFLKLSKCLGYQINFIKSSKNIEKKLKKILETNKPTVCEIIMPPMQELIPRVQIQMNKDGTFEPAMLDNMYPFFSKERLIKIREKLLSIN